MKIFYDPDVDVLRVLFNTNPIEESDEERPGLILDYDSDGNVVGIEVLNASEKANLRVEAAKQGHSMEEAARQILRRALMPSGTEAGGLGSRVHQYFVEGGAVDLELPERSAPRSAPDFTRPDA
ncbi:MAG: DUF2283 domain-containing protein [Actinobacteria bacterium]|nr:DUF2283 domain-containing protein [Actinomycetota bacterium]